MTGGIMRLAIFVICLMTCHSALAYEPDDLLKMFDYKNGDRPWETHVPSEINGTFEDALERDICRRCYACAGTAEDSLAIPFHRLRATCMQGYGAKMVIPRGHPSWKSLVVDSPEHGGLFEKTHMVRGIPEHYYEPGPGFETKYFLVPFDDYEIPTYFPAAAPIYLQYWKQLFLEHNEIDEDYFKRHVRVIGAEVRHNSRDSSSFTAFIVHYYFHVGWARVALQDFVPVEWSDSSIEETLATADEGQYLATLKNAFGRRPDLHIRIVVQKIDPIGDIASPRVVAALIHESSELLWFNIDRHLKIDRRSGKLFLETWGTVDDAANKCITSKVWLHEGVIGEIQDVACRIY